MMETLKLAIQWNMEAALRRAAAAPPEVLNAAAAWVRETLR